MDYAWLIVASMLVFLMQAGFLCLETGKIRSKNSINVAAKNISDLVVAVAIYWLFGFGLMFGDSVEGFWGSSEFVFGAEQSPWQISFFFFQLMFCGTAATLLSGAVAERMSYYGYVLVTILLCTCIYPVVGHWVWASAYNQGNAGWLQQQGFIDFAGATVVHSVGGWVALASVMVIGPRTGRFDANTELPVGSNLPLSVLGTLFIWLGWFGFNAGSTLIFDGNVPGILLNTCLAAAWGGLASSLLFYVRHRYVDVTYSLNGVISGLVSVTAAVHAVSPGEAAFIGVVGGVVLYVGTQLMDKCRLDDALGVVPAHLFAGMWGTLAVALFGDLALLNTGLNRVEQLIAQLLGITAIGAYCFTLAWCGLKLINRFVPLRVSKRQEMLGMNITEHHATTELIDLLSSMQEQEELGQFDQPVPEEPFTEVGQIARQYNRVIHRVQDEMSRRDKAIDNFRSSEKRKSAILDASMDGIVSINLQGHIIEFNPAAENIFGLRKNHVINKNFVELFVLEEEQAAIRDSLQHRFTTSSGLLLNRRNRLQLKRISGDNFPAEITVTVTNIGVRSHREFTLNIRDVTRQQKLQDKLRQLAYSDPLTGLYNRTYLLNSLTRAVELGESYKEDVAVFFLDLDRFKQINDTLGHKAGDELLMEVSERLTQVTEENDTIARWGGDEFVILMSGNLSDEVLHSIASKILVSMRETVELSGRELKILTSIGVAVKRHNRKADRTITAENLIQHADIAMYYAKEAGRDNYKLFLPEMANIASKQFHYEQSLRIALKKSEQIQLVYQPKVNENGQLTGIEALARWEHPQEGLVSPNQFIPVAEETGLIIDLEEVIIEKVLRQLDLWRKAGKTLLPVAINLSGKHLLSENLLPNVVRLLDKYGISGELIEFEVTEGVFLNEKERCVQVLQGLKQLNVSVAIDDFGTGYSSLSYLKVLPLDVLKIDRSFVEECASSMEDAKICATIIHLATSLELKTVAEGVETQEQFEFLQQKGCKQFQGYYFYRPLPPNELEPLLPDIGTSSVTFNLDAGLQPI